MKFLTKFFICFSFFLIGICIVSLKQKTKYYNKLFKLENTFKEKNREKPFTKRKLNVDCSEHDDEYSFFNLSIYIDFAEFNETFPKEEPELNIDNFIFAMNEAKDILESFLEIRTDICSDGIRLTNEEIDYIKDNYEITNYTSVFENDYLKPGEFNFYIFSKFTELHEESASVVLDDYVSSPLVGIILFNNNLSNIDKTKFTKEYLINLMLHHFIKLLGFNTYFSNTEYEYLPYDDEKEVYYLSLTGELSFPTVINYAQKYFNCSEIRRIDLYLDDENLDEDGFYYDYAGNDIIGLYWPKRQFLGELLTKFDYPEEQILSGFTLAFLDDIPYLHVKENYIGGLMKFGKNKGCEFFYNYCGNSSNPLFTFANEFYLPKEQTNAQEPSCSSGRQSKTIYTLRDIDDNEKSSLFEYYLGDKEKAGFKYTNYCPIAHYNNVNKINIYSGRCSEINYTEKDEERKEELGDNSFCVLSSLRNSQDTDTQVKALCYEMFCSSRALTIKIGEYYIVCPRGGGKVEAKYLDGFLLCPDYNLICTSSEMCNNLIDCIKKNSKELEESFFYDYEIKTLKIQVYIIQVISLMHGKKVMMVVVLLNVCNAQLKKIVLDVVLIIFMKMVNVKILCLFVLYLKMKIMIFV